MSVKKIIGKRQRLKTLPHNVTYYNNFSSQEFHVIFPMLPSTPPLYPS